MIAFLLVAEISLNSKIRHQKKCGSLVSVSPQNFVSMLFFTPEKA